MKQKSEILFGYHSIYEALKAGKRTINTLYISRKRAVKRADKIEALADKKNVNIEYTRPEKIDKLTQHARHQGMAADVSLFPLKSINELKTGLENQNKDTFVLILESIEDPHNLGALIRTGLCAGVDHILIPKDRAAHPSSSVSRSSAGAMEHADIYLVTNTASVLKSLKKYGMWIFGLDAAGDTSLFNADFQGNIGLVVGGEHKGIRPLVKKECDFLLSIPNQGKINSLNASVAGGVAMFEALRQRRR